MDMKSSTDWNEIIIYAEQPSCQVFYLLCTLQRMGSQTFVKCVSDFSFMRTFLCEVVKWYGADRFYLFLGGKSNESETCGLGLELGLNLRPVDLDLTISESEVFDLDLDLEEEDLALDLDLPLCHLTTSLCNTLFNGM